MEFIAQIPSPQTFLHFGCWNNRNEEDGKSMDLVMDKINEYISEKTDTNKLEFIVIAGDNYYPEKSKDENNKKKKIIYTERLNSGFEKLPKDIVINMILGNHDLETNMDVKTPKLFVKDSEEKQEEVEKDCFILENEKEIVNEKPPGNIHLNLFNHKILNHETLLLMIDTSMYSLEEEAKDYLQCYNHILSGTNYNNIEDLKNAQEKFILDTIKQNDNVKHIIIVGHHPIIGVKSKKEKKNKKKGGGDKIIEILDDIPNFLDVLEKIKIAKPNANYYYLCADLHLYQHGEITITNNDNNANNMTIQQYIVGTGGTKLDDEIPIEHINNHYDRQNGKNGNIVFKNYKYNTNYKLIKSKCEHGFLECVITSYCPKFEFISVTEQTTNAGKKRSKTIRKKNIKRKSRKSRRRRD